MSAWDFYTFQRSLLPVVMAMTQRGLLVDDGLRQARVTALAGEAAVIREQVRPQVEALKEKLRETKLLWKTTTCKSCRNGSKKRIACSSCSGAGKSTVFTFNMASGRQLADVLYNGLRLPRRTRDGHVTVDEEALKSLLAIDSTGFVASALRFAKLDTMREIYERLAPARDGRVRTVFNIAGTYTSRFSSAEAFYVPNSTNLQNLPAQEAARDPLYRVRDCITPGNGQVFLYADLSQAEARVAAVLSEDWELLRRWVDPTWDLHKWTAAQIYGVTEAQVTPGQRFLGKKCRHALNYGMGTGKFWRTVNDEADLSGIAITMAEAKRIHAGYHGLHPNLDGVWWNRVQARLEARMPMLATHCGWRAPLWPRFTDEGVLEHETLRAGIAWEPQHTVVHVLNEGMKELYDGETAGGYKLLLQGHDSVLLETAEANVADVAQRAKRALERPLRVNDYALTIPAEVFVCRRTWAEMERVL